MSASTWTPTALASELTAWSGEGWRAVEAQHQVATMSLVGGDPAAQAVLEDILEGSKPALPESVRGLHWLIATPFRYYPLPGGSRFRSALDPGVLYGAETRATACAEAGYWRLRMWRDSEGLRSRAASLPLTLFQFRASTDRALDLTCGALARDAAAWTAPSDYSATQALAARARSEAVELIRYASVRHPGGHCLAVLDPAPFRTPAAGSPLALQSWTLHLVPPARITWQRELDAERFSFDFADLAG